MVTFLSACIEDPRAKLYQKPFNIQEHLITVLFFLYRFLNCIGDSVKLLYCRMFFF